MGNMLLKVCIFIAIACTAPCIIWWASWLSARTQSRVIRYKNNVR